MHYARAMIWIFVACIHVCTHAHKHTWPGALPPDIRQTTNVYPYTYTTSYNGLGDGYSTVPSIVTNGGSIVSDGVVFAADYVSMTNDNVGTTAIGFSRHILPAVQTLAAAMCSPTVECINGILNVSTCECVCFYGWGDEKCSRYIPDPTNTTQRGRRQVDRGCPIGQQLSDGLCTMACYGNVSADGVVYERACVDTDTEPASWLQPAKNVLYTNHCRQNDGLLPTSFCRCSGSDTLEYWVGRVIHRIAMHTDDCIIGNRSNTYSSVSTYPVRIFPTSTDICRDVMCCVAYAAQPVFCVQHGCMYTRIGDNGPRCVFNDTVDQDQIERDMGYTANAPVTVGVALQSASVEMAVHIAKNRFVTTHRQMAAAAGVPWGHWGPMLAGVALKVVVVSPDTHSMQHAFSDYTWWRMGNWIYATTRNEVYCTSNWTPKKRALRPLAAGSHLADDIVNSCSQINNELPGGYGPYRMFERLNIKTELWTVATQQHQVYLIPSHWKIPSAYYRTQVTSSQCPLSDVKRRNIVVECTNNPHPQTSHPDIASDCIRYKMESMGIYRNPACVIFVWTLLPFNTG